MQPELPAIGGNAGNLPMQPIESSLSDSQKGMCNTTS